eukprot:CAMPEP_0181037004 /NCGR_PEP_ID=MMETSP1070-20121207/9169_1 /TAXON_ID=265543 /ORGANISM="Minutocellus polymorphus, Strain NH13" /LENGTH=53 /DNA_ID=CAMNT_0023114689 /DNA_START=680 /DNA_END=838 /DNA_ORIENTATION=+
MFRRCPSMENGQPTFAAAMSPHQQHAHAHLANQYNQHYRPPNGTPNSHNGYPT